MAEQVTPAPDVSVVIPCYNSENWIGRAIDSALAQEGVTVQVIVVNDGSTDRSLDVIRGYGDRIRCETGPNLGACAARNRGLELVQSDYVVFLDADDFLEGRFLDGGLSAIKEGKADIAFGQMETELNGRRFRIKPPNCENRDGLIHHFMAKGFFPISGSTLWSRDLIVKGGGWMEGIRRYQDYEFVFRMLKSHPKTVAFDKGRAVYVQHNSANRISLRTDIETVKDQARVIRFIGSCVNDTALPVAEKSRLMQQRTYIFWRYICRSGDTAAMQIARDLYTEFGGSGHIGSLAHRIMASLLGLRAKEWIALRFESCRRGARRLYPFTHKA